MRTSIRRCGSARGFTLIELALSITILGSLVAALGWFQIRSQASYRQTAVRAEIEAKARQAASRVIRELTGVGTTLLAPDPTSSFGSSTLTFQKPIAVSDAGVVTWSTPSRLELQDDEADDGMDSDSDGLVDEKRLVLIQNVGLINQQAITICHGIAELAPGELSNGADDDGDGLVDEAGFNVQRTSDLLRIRLTLLKWVGDGTTVDVEVSTALVLHN